MVKATVLDNLDVIKEVDRSSMLSFCVDASKHYSEAARLAKHVSFDYAKPKSIIVAGMGGSAIGGELLKDLTRDRISVPIEVCREYSLPSYADKKTLVFVVSYSGETEESLSVFLDALKRRCMVICISSGGKLRDFAHKMGVPHLRVPSGMAPRATLPYLFMPLPMLLEETGLVSGAGRDVSELVKVLRLISLENAPEKPLSGNFCKTLAVNVCGTVPVVYGFGFYRAVAQRFKTQFNENSKIPAKWEWFSELNHNEIVGWEEARKLGKLFSIIFIRDVAEPVEMQWRIEATQKLVSDESLKTFEVWSRGESRLAKMLSLVCIGDFTSVYLALLRGVDPTPVRTISLVKEKIAQSGVRDKVISELQKLAK